ncbi:MAG: TonB-dependent receptor plug domain-containing protein [Gammaproteobacteria bacterium]|nr:TonB-dependent receptor plug domain-containing protein [Gammaproteobacteria bacterium]
MRRSFHAPATFVLLYALALCATAAEPSGIEQMTVSGWRDPARGPALPSDLTVSGPFGSARALADTPRAMTAVTPELMERFGVVELRDLNRVAPNLYGANTFGQQSLPSIRGQLGEIFVDGLRRQGGNNGLGLPLSFNAFDQVTVVKGPAPVVLGATQRVGGFLELAQKRPDLDTRRGELRVQGGSWDRFRQQLDYSTPLVAGVSGVRLSVENRDEESFYDHGYYESQDVYLAFRHRPDGNTLFDASFEYFDVDFTDNAGWNRATQDLIDDGRYITGQGRQANGSRVPAAGAVIKPTGSVQLPRSRTYTDPDDVNGADSYAVNLHLSHRLNDLWRIENRTLYQHLEREAVAQNSFVEIIDGADTVENRIEFIADYALPLFGAARRQQTDIGLDLRYHDVLGFSQFTTEADNPVDLAGPLVNRRIPLTAAQRAALVQLRRGLFVSPGAQYDVDNDGDGDFRLSDTTDSTAWQLGFFLQQDAQLSDRWRLLFGGRGDAFWVTARDGAPPAGVSRARDTANALLASANGSLQFQATAALMAYFTVSYSESTSNSLGGGFVLGAGNRIAPENFATASQLHEFGLKFAPPGSAWYADVALFDQTRSLRNRDGSNSGVLTRGIESQLMYRPDRHLYANVGASYLNARFDDSLAFQDSRTVNDAFDNSRPDLVAGTGVGSPSFTVFGPSSRRVPGLPSVLISGLVSYEFDNGVGASVNGQYTNAFRLDFLNTVRIRDQFTVNAAVHYYHRPLRTDVRAEIFNLTDEENFAPIFDGGYFGSTDVLPELPRSFMVSLTHRF